MLLDHARQRRHGAPPGVRGAVVVGVVQQQQRPRRRAVRHAPRDRLRRGALLPVAPPVAPQQRAPAAATGEAQRGGVEHPVGRAVEPDGDTRGVLDRGLRAVDVLPRLAGREAQQVAVAVAVQADAVPGGHDLARQRRIAAHLLADEEERRRYARRGQHVQHRRRSLAVGAVVEGERVPLPARGAILDPQRPAQNGQVGRERRQRVARGERARERTGHPCPTPVPRGSFSPCAGFSALQVPPPEAGGSSPACGGCDHRRSWNSLSAWWRRWWPRPSSASASRCRRWTPARRPRRSTCAWRSRSG